jgi:hypothetical protein
MYIHKYHYYLPRATPLLAVSLNIYKFAVMLSFSVAYHNMGIEIGL